MASLARWESFVIWPTSVSHILMDCVDPKGQEPAEDQRPQQDLCPSTGLRIEPRMTGIVSTMQSGITYVHLFDTSALYNPV